MIISDFCLRASSTFRITFCRCYCCYKSWNWKRVKAATQWTVRVERYQAHETHLPTMLLWMSAARERAGQCCSETGLRASSSQWVWCFSVVASWKVINIMYFARVCTVWKRRTWTIHSYGTEEWRPENRSRPELKQEKAKVVFLAQVLANNNLLALADSISCQHQPKPYMRLQRKLFINREDTHMLLIEEFK